MKQQRCFEGLLAATWQGASSHRPGLTLETQCPSNMMIKCTWHLKLGQLTVSARIAWSDTGKDEREGSGRRLFSHSGPGSGPGPTRTELGFFHQTILPLRS